MPRPRIHQVRELVRLARQALEARFGDILVEGEISGSKRSANGHIYFTLKDTEAQLDCVMYAREAARTKFRIVDGIQVRCQGKLTIYEGRGRFQLQVQTMEPAGLGALAVAFEALKQRLALEGLFDPARKKALPFLPRLIGVVTSAQGAVIRDIIRVAHRRFPIPILLSPAPVQGENAVPGLIAAISALCKIPKVDLIILARGGGSMEDLWAFNDEALARALSVCPLPIISAVGHETDFTIADFVADKRAPTPSAAAEMAVPVWEDLVSEVRTLEGRLQRALLSQVHRRRLLLERLQNRVSAPRQLLAGRFQALDDLAERLQAKTLEHIQRHRTRLAQLEARILRAHPRRRIADQQDILRSMERRLTHAGSLTLAKRRQHLFALTAKLQALSPLGVLDRGFCLLKDASGQLIFSHETLRPGNPVTVTLRTADLHTTIDRIVPTSHVPPLPSAPKLPKG